MAHPGFIEWATSIRATMANDPGRQIFQDQVRTHGFLFLKDYLENILAGPKQDPIIELVKTPGRKKSRKTKRDYDKQQSISVSNMASLAPPVIEQMELSVIAEGDESAECSRASLLFFRNGGNLGASPALPAQTTFATHDTKSQANTTAVNVRRSSAKNDSVSSADSFHSATFSPPVVPEQLPDVPPASDVLQSTAPKDSINATSIRVISTLVENDTEPLPEMPPWHPPSSRLDEAVTEPLPLLPQTDSAMQMQEIGVPVRDTVTHSPKVLAHKKSTSFVSVLVAPIPPRKSTRVPREPSNVGLTSNATPGAALGSKRSSWLIKAREAKAMEDTTNKPFAATTVASMVAAMPPASATLKRKSSGNSAGRDEGRIRHKAAKISDADTAPTAFNPRGALQEKKDKQQTDEMQMGLHLPLPSHFSVLPVPQPQIPDPGPTDQLTPEYDEQDGILNRLKRTVEGLGSRVGKSMGKSLGGTTAASLLAEARAAAEARVAKREIAAGSLEPAQSSLSPEVGPSDPPTAYVADHSRLSVSDLVPTQDTKTVNNDDLPRRLPTPPVFLPKPPTVAHVPKNSTSTTPPNSPIRSRPATSTHPAHPFFRTSPVFVPPPKTSPAFPTGELSSKPQQSSRIPLPDTTVVPSILTQPRQRIALSAQTTLESLAPDSIFDSQEDACMPTTQDTECSPALGSQHSAVPERQYQQYMKNLDDDDDSWPLVEKLPVWTFPTAGDDDSWSSMNSEAPEADPDAAEMKFDPVNEGVLPSSGQDMPAAFESQPDQAYENEYLGLDESELDEVDIESGLSTVSLVEPKAIPRSGSQLSVASSSSSNLGFLGQASKFVGSVLGASKKAKTEVKSLQRAAVAAKKQQEEMDKKVVRLKEMENRRQRALQRKAEEEKARITELERKLKEERERQKRERDELTDKRPIRNGAEKDDDTTKKRKLVVEIDKKLMKKAPAKSGVSAKPANFSKQLAMALNASTLNNVSQPATISSSSVKTADTKTTKTPAGKIIKPKAKVIAKAQEDDVEPSQVVQSQMAARVKTQIQAAKQAAGDHEMTSESIELPDINSEYSDSGDERPPGSFNPPGWAQSPELRQALQMQSTMNPDEIFGAVRPLRMEEIFRARTSRFRARTSSANWAGSDRLTVEEEREYARRMGFR